MTGFVYSPARLWAELDSVQAAGSSRRATKAATLAPLAPPALLHTELALPARTPRDIFAVCDPVRALTPEEQPVLHEDLSEVQGGDRFGRIELRLRRAGPGRYLRELVTGHSGCGKSTELLRLASALRVPKDGAAFHVVYVDANASLSPHEARLPQLLVALLAALAEEPRWDLRATRSGHRCGSDSAGSSVGSVMQPESWRMQRGSRSSARCSRSISTSRADFARPRRTTCSR